MGENPIQIARIWFNELPELTQIKVPRCLCLELIGAVVGVRLATSVSKALEIDINKVTFWSNSLNVLWWIRGKSRDVKPFVANSVGEVQRNTNAQQWRHVPINDNPADILSRGM